MEETPVTHAPKQTWRELYRAALAAANSVQARKKIDMACAAILQRIDELAGARDRSAIEEQLEILDSLHNLRRIQKLESHGPTDANQSSQHTPQEGALMTHTCRKWQDAPWRKGQRSCSALRHARIVTDPKIVAQLNAEVEKRKLLPSLTARPNFRDQ